MMYQQPTPMFCFRFFFPVLWALCCLSPLCHPTPLGCYISLVRFSRRRGWSTKGVLGVVVGQAGHGPVSAQLVGSEVAVVFRPDDLDTGQVQSC
jgi:hypothetical protein